MTLNRNLDDRTSQASPTTPRRLSSPPRSRGHVVPQSVAHRPAKQPDNKTGRRCTKADTVNATPANHLPGSSMSPTLVYGGTRFNQEMAEKLLMGTRGMMADPVYRRMPDITYDVWQLVVPAGAENVGDQFGSTTFDPAAPNGIHWWPGKDGQGIETLLCGRVVEAHVLTGRDKDFVSIGCAYLEGANAYLVIQPEVGPAFWLVRFAEGAPIVEEEGSGKSYYYFVASPKALHRWSLTGTFDLKEEPIIHPHFDAGCSHKVDPHNRPGDTQRQDSRLGECPLSEPPAVVLRHVDDGGTRR